MHLLGTDCREIRREKWMNFKKKVSNNSDQTAVSHLLSGQAQIWTRPVLSFKDV